MVTPEIASEWLSTYQFERQRKIRQWHINFLAEEMKNGRFLAGTQIRFSVGKDKTRIIDGQHRLSAVVKSNLPQVFSVLWMPEDPNSGYGRLDIGLTRTPQDMFSAIHLSEEVGLGPDMINRVGTSVKFINAGFHVVSSNYARLATDDQADMIREYSQAAGAYTEIIAGMPMEMRAGMLRSATMSVALATLRFASTTLGKSKVEDFWTGVTFDDGLSIGDPRKTANRHILTTGMPSGKRVSNKTVWSASYSARYLANCWNAWVDDREIKQTRVADERSKISLAGTPFNGK